MRAVHFSIVQLFQQVCFSIWIIDSCIHVFWPLRLFFRYFDNVVLFEYGSQKTCRKTCACASLKMTLQCLWDEWRGDIRRGRREGHQRCEPGAVMQTGDVWMNSWNDQKHMAPADGSQQRAARLFISLLCSQERVSSCYLEMVD